MQAKTPRFFECDLICQESGKEVLYHLYVELSDFDQRLWQAAQDTHIRLTKLRTGVLGILPPATVPTDVGKSAFIFRDIDARTRDAAPALAKENRRAWIVRQERIGGTEDYPASCQTAPR